MGNSTLVDLLRHGEAAGGALYRGRQDDPLSPNGWQQMREAVTGGGPWQAVISSDLRRCADFALELSDQLSVPLYSEPQWRELDFGRWEGRTAEDILAEDAEALGAFWRDPVSCHPPGGERLSVFAERVLTAWDRWLPEMSGGRWLLVVHGGVIRVLLAHVLGMSLSNLLRIEVPYACRSTLLILATGEGMESRLLSHGA